MHWEQVFFTAVFVFYSEITSADTNGTLFVYVAFNFSKFPLPCNQYLNEKAQIVLGSIYENFKFLVEGFYMKIIFMFF